MYYLLYSILYLLALFLSFFCSIFLVNFLLFYYSLNSFVIPCLLVVPWTFFCFLMTCLHFLFTLPNSPLLSFVAVYIIFRACRYFIFPSFSLFLSIFLGMNLIYIRKNRHVFIKNMPILI